MRCFVLGIVGGVLLASSQVPVLAQGRPADLPGGSPIGDLNRRPMPLEPIPQGRQPGWVDENATPAGSQLEPERTPPDAREQASPSAPEIRTYVAQLTNAALSPDGCRKATGMLSDDDRQRLQKDIHPDDARAYNDLVQRFRTQWKARYGEDFDLAKQNTVMSGYYVLRGPQPDEPITVGGTMGPNRNPQNPTPKPNGQQQVPTPRATQERMATMIVPPNAEAQQPAMMLQFRNEADGKPTNWRLSTPQSLTGERLQENLKTRMQKMLDGQAKWPADSREAYRLMSYHVLASMADQPLDRPRQPQPGQPGAPAKPDNPSLES